jgi:hypothetical protein
MIWIRKCKRKRIAEHRGRIFKGNTGLEQVDGRQHVARLIDIIRCPLTPKRPQFPSEK